MITPLVAALAAGWASLLIAAPYLPVAVAGLLYLFGSIICHQIAERSFHVDGAQLPVCARCLGLYVGAALGAVAATSSRLVPGSDPTTTRHWGLTPFIVAAMPTIVTVLAEWAGIWQPSNLVRAVAGVPAGVVVAFLVMATLRRPALHYGPCPPRRPIASSRRPTPC